MWICNKIYSDRSEVDLLDETMRIKNFYFSRKLWWKNYWKLPKMLRCRKTRKPLGLQYFTYLCNMSVNHCNIPAICSCPYPRRNHQRRSIYTSIWTERRLTLPGRSISKLVRYYYMNVSSSLFQIYSFNSSRLILLIICLKIIFFYVGLSRNLSR